MQESHNLSKRGFTYIMLTGLGLFVVSGCLGLAGLLLIMVIIFILISRFFERL